MMTRRSLTLLALLTLAAPAQALKLSVWDRELQTKLGDGESVGGKFNVRLVGDYDGPVVVLFAQTDEEKARAAFPGLKNRYNGTLMAGQLSLQPVVSSSFSGTSLPVPNSGVTLAKFLAPFKLIVVSQPAGQSLSLPGLKTPDGQK